MLADPNISPLVYEQLRSLRFFLLGTKDLCSASPKGE